MGPDQAIPTDEEIADVYRQLGLDDEQKRDSFVAMAATPTIEQQNDVPVTTTNSTR